MTTATVERRGVRDMAEFITLPFCHIHGYSHESHDLEHAWLDLDECILETWQVVRLDAHEHEATDEEPPTECEDMTYALRKGSLAYIDSVRGGLVPCKVLGVSDEGVTQVRITASRSGWGRGEVEFLENPWLSLVHRGQVSDVRSKRPRITGQVRIQADSGKRLWHQSV